MLGAGVFAVIILIGGLRSYLRWTEVQYFGEIIEVKDGSFLIKTGEDGERLILMNQSTNLRRGREFLEEKLQIGDYVIIVGSPNQDGSVEARVIRLVKPPRGAPL